MTIAIVLAWLLSGNEGNAPADEIDWTYVGFVLAAPVLLGAAYVLGRRRQPWTDSGESRGLRSSAHVVHCVTAALLLLFVALLGPALFGALVLDPVG